MLSINYCCLMRLEIVSEYDQEIPQSHTWQRQSFHQNQSGKTLLLIK